MSTEPRGDVPDVPGIIEDVTGAANVVAGLLLEVWDEAVARGAGPEVFERLAEHLVSVIPDLVDCPTAAPVIRGET